jgi:hypothetical protein
MKIEFIPDSDTENNQQQQMEPVSNSEATKTTGQLLNNEPLAPENTGDLPVTQETTPETITQLPIIEETKTEPAKPVKNEPVKSQKANDLFSITVKFRGDEVEHVKHIIEERVKSGMTQDNSHFVRQCVDFAINYKFVFKQKGFSIPDDSPKLFLKDAYFQNNK